MEPVDDSVARRASVARELEVLEAARHPGVVEVLGVDEAPDGPILRTAPVDGVPLARLGPLTIEEVAGTAAAVASTLADLHDLGFVHGALTPERILVGGEGRPLLCGFGHGGRVGETPPGPPGLPAEAVDPAGADGLLHPGADVFALGVLVRDLADRTAGGAGGPQSRRGRPSRRPGDALRAVADRATVADRHLRPSARAFAAAVGHAVPEACLPRRPGTAGRIDPRSKALDGRVVAADGASSLDPLLALRHRDTDGDGPRAASHHRLGRARALVRRRGRRWSWGCSPQRGRRLAIGAGVAVVAGVAGSVALGASSSTSPRPPAPVDRADGGWPPGSERPAAPAVPPSRVVSTAPTTVAQPRPAVTSPAGRACAPVVAALSADTDGDGCPEALRWADGVLEASGSRWAVGRPGDQVATGDWDCAGSRTLALLRPSTGEVFVFPGWAGAGADVTAAVQTVVEGGFALRAGDLDTDGCPELLVDRSGREAVAVPTTAVAP